MFATRLKFGAGGQTPPVSGSKEPPLPFRESAVDDTDAVFSMLVQWVIVWAEMLGEVAPSAAQVAWYREQVSGGEPTGELEVQGFDSDLDDVAIRLDERAAAADVGKVWAGRPA